MFRLSKNDPDPSRKTGVYRIVDGLDRKMRLAFYDALALIKDEASLKDLEEAFRRGGISAAIDEIGNIDDAFSATLVPTLNGAVAQSGRLAVTTTLNSSVAQSFKFNMLNPETVKAVQNHGARLVKEISNNTLKGILEATEVGIITGQNPRQQARQFRSALGLTQNQAQAVASYRKSLVDGSVKSLTYGLQDGRYKKTVERSLREGKALTGEQIDKMVNRYEQRFIKYRSEVIGRTESMRAVSMGDFESGRQAEESGAMDETFLRFWVDTKDKRERPNHRFINGMNSEGRLFSEKFRTPDGPLKYPRDPDGTAENTIQCRCTTVLRRKGSFFA